MSIRKKGLNKRNGCRGILQEKNDISEDTDKISVDIENLGKLKTGSCQHIPGIGTKCFSP
jgi:hypothetical protein